MSFYANIILLFVCSSFDHTDNCLENAFSLVHFVYCKYRNSMARLKVKLCSTFIVRKLFLKCTLQAMKTVIKYRHVERLFTDFTI